MAKKKLGYKERGAVAYSYNLPLKDAGCINLARGQMEPYPFFQG
jgi:hypothetical protein